MRLFKLILCTFKLKEPLEGVGTARSSYRAQIYLLKPKNTRTS